MKTAIAVIGSGYGDEGKGLMTDYFAARYPGNAVVARFNGGAQAGHTVVTPDGRRHVFSHFGAGTLAGAHTYLSKHMLVNPILFNKEEARLIPLVGEETPPVVWVDTRAKVTTPWDMMLNQLVEQRRGDGRHGSVGLGIGETVERNLVPEFSLTVDDLTYGAEDRLRAIMDHWVPRRLAALGISLATLDEEWRDRLTSDVVLANFVHDIICFLAGVNLDRQGDYLAKTGRQIIFEGAQGLRLDQDYHEFPHVTRSHTGLRNVVDLMGENGIATVAATYVTRAYKTRHGAGPFREHVEGLAYEDDTNVPHEYQGTMRFGHLDTNELHIDILDDVDKARRLAPTIRIGIGVAVTHMDQVGERVAIRRKGSTYDLTHAQLCDWLYMIGQREPWRSFGPTRETISQRK